MVLQADCVSEIAAASKGVRGRMWDGVAVRKAWRERPLPRETRPMTVRASEREASHVQRWKEAEDKAGEEGEGAARGMSDDHHVGEGAKGERFTLLSAVAFGLLHTFLVLDGCKVLALFLTGPHLINKLPEGPVRAIVRNTLKPIHKPLAAILV